MLRWETGPYSKTTLDCLFLPGLTSPPFPNQQLLESAHCNSGRVMEAEWRLLPIIKGRPWGTQKGFVPRSPSGPCMITIAMSWERLSCKTLRNRQILKGEEAKEGHEGWHSRQRDQQKQSHGDGGRQSTPRNYVFSRLVVGACWEATWEVRTRELNPVLVVEGLTARGWSEGTADAGEQHT